MGGLAVGGVGYTAATGSWDSFAGGLAGGITGTLAGKGMVALAQSFQSQAAAQNNGASMYAGSEPVKRSFSVTVRMVNENALTVPEKELLLEQVTADSMKSAAQGLAGMEGIFTPAELARLKMVGYGALGVQALGELYSVTKLYAMVQNGVISSDKFSQALAVHAAGVFVKAGAAAVGEAVGAVATKSAGGAFLVAAGTGAAASIGWDTFEDAYD